MTTSKDRTKKYYVYLHRRLKDNSVFYVGYGQNGRSQSKKNRNVWWNNIVKYDKGFKTEILKDKLTQLQAEKLEKKTINEYGMKNLTNMTNGGDGGDTLSNHPNKKEIGKKIRKKIIGEDNPNYGKGYYYWWVKKYGKEKADEMQREQSRKRSEATKGKPGYKRNETFKETCRKKWGDEFDVKWEEHTKKLSESVKKSWIKRKERG